MASLNRANPGRPRSADDVRVEMLDLCDAMATLVLDARAHVEDGRMGAASRCASDLRQIADAASIHAHGLT